MTEEEKVKILARIERDAVHNSSLPKSHTVHTKSEEWLDWGPGIQLQLLRATPETGHWAVLFKCAAGSAFGRHEHLGAAEYLILKGKLSDAQGRITAVEGDYTYEPNGVIHDANSFPEETIVLHVNHGPLKFLDDDDNITFVLDWQTLVKADLAAQGDKITRSDVSERAELSQVT